MNIKWNTQVKELSLWLNDTLDYVARYCSYAFDRDKSNDNKRQKAKAKTKRENKKWEIDEATDSYLLNKWQIVDLNGNVIFQRVFTEQQQIEADKRARKIKHRFVVEINWKGKTQEIIQIQAGKIKRAFIN